MADQILSLTDHRFNKRSIDMLPERISTGGRMFWMTFNEDSTSACLFGSARFPRIPFARAVPSVNLSGRHCNSGAGNCPLQAQFEEIIGAGGRAKKKRELLGGTYKLGEHTSFSTAARVES